MFKQNYLHTVMGAICHFCNQPLFANETVMNPVKFWQIYRHRQMLEECWNYDVIQWFEKCWHIKIIQLSDNCISLEKNSHSIGI